MPPPLEPEVEVLVGVAVGDPGVGVRVRVGVMVGESVIVGVLVGPHPGNCPPALLTVEQAPSLIGPRVTDWPLPSFTSK